MRIKPVELNRVAPPVESAMGIVRLIGRDVVRLSTDAHERTGRVASSDTRGGGQQPVVGSAPSVKIVAYDRARDSAADRTRVRRGQRSEGEGSRAS